MTFVPVELEHNCSTVLDRIYPRDLEVTVEPHMTLSVLYLYLEAMNANRNANIFQKKSLYTRCMTSGSTNEGSTNELQIEMSQKQF